MGLTSFVREAIGCYLADPEAAWIGLEHARSEINARKCPEDLEEDRKAEQKSTKSTAKALRKRLLEALPRVSTDGNNAERTSHDTPISGTPTPLSYKDLQEKLEKAHIAHILDVLTLKINQEREDWIETFPNLSRSVSRGDLLGEMREEEILAFGDCSDWIQIEREYDLFLRKQPDYEAYLLRKQLDWIERTAGKIENDTPLECRGRLPKHIRDFLFVANWCNLHGLDAACAVMSGAVLQQAIQEKYDERRRELQRFGIHSERVNEGATLGTVIEQASRADKDAPVLSATVAEKARCIMEIRNDAAHGNTKFFERPEDERKGVLALTMEILETLYYSGSES